METQTDPAAELAGMIVGLLVRLVILAAKLAWWAFRRPWWALAVWLLAPLVLGPTLAGRWAAVRWPVCEVLVTLCLVEVLVPRAARAMRRMVQRRKTRRGIEKAGGQVASAVRDPEEAALKAALPKGLRPAARRRLAAWRENRDRRRLVADLKAAEAAGVDAAAVAWFAAAVGVAPPSSPAPQSGAPTPEPEPEPTAASASAGEGAS